MIDNTVDNMKENNNNIDNTVDNMKENNNNIDNTVDNIRENNLDNIKLSETRCDYCNKLIPLSKIRNYADDVKDRYKHHFCDKTCKERYHSRQQTKANHEPKIYNVENIKHTETRCDHCNKLIPPSKIRNYADDVKDRYKHHFCDKTCKERHHSRQQTKASTVLRDTLKHDKIEFTKTITVQKLRNMPGEEMILKIVPYTIKEMDMHLLMHPEHKSSMLSGDTIRKDHIEYHLVGSFVAVCRHCKTVIGRSHTKRFGKRQKITRRYNVYEEYNQSKDEYQLDDE